MSERYEWQAASERLELYINEYTFVWDEKLAASAKGDVALASHLFALMASAPDAETLERNCNHIDGLITVEPDRGIQAWLRAVAALLAPREGAEP